MYIKNLIGDSVLRMMLTMLLNIFIIMSALTLSAETHYSTNTIVWTYQIVNGEASLGGGTEKETAIPADTTGNVVLPSTIDGFPVTRIGKYAFYQCKCISGVALPNSIRSIGECAFYDCTNLQSIGLQNNVTNISRYSFTECRSLREIEIPSSIERINESIFSRCVNLKSVKIPNSVTTIGEMAFYGCKNLSSINIPDSVTKICRCAFGSCGIESIVIPSSVKYLGQEAFANNKMLCSVVVPENESLYLGSGIFSGCVSLIEWPIPNCVTNFGGAVYQGCYCTNIVLPSLLTTIPNYCFAGCANLISVTIPEKVRFISASAFSSCSNLKRIIIKGDLPQHDGDVFKGCSSFPEIYAERNNLCQWSGRNVFFNTNGSLDGNTIAQLTVTNVVIHYVMNGVQPEKVIPAAYDTGFVNIVTEIKSGGVVSVPTTWLVNFPNFVSKFGNDFTKALMKHTGKYDASGNEMFVWQDYVAGTDPTDENDVFTASITIVDGSPVISYSPEFSDASEAAMRKYTIWGKKSLLDEQWTEVNVTSVPKYNFFKVTVEMR